MTRVRTPSTPFLRAEIERAIALRAQNLPWATIAERLGKDRGALEVAVCRYRKGQWSGRYERRLARAAAVERLIATTGIVTVPQIADALGTTFHSADALLRKIGLDREMREELAGLDPSARADTRPTARHYTQDTLGKRPHPRANPARLRRIVAAHASGIDTALGAERFGLASAKCFTDMASYARRRLSRSQTHPLPVGRGGIEGRRG